MSNYFAAQRRRAGRWTVRSAAVAGATLTGALAAAPLAAQELERTTVLEEIVVTAEKRTQNVQDVPASISVLSGKNLEELAATQLSDYASYVPGFVVGSGGGPGRTQLTLRGLALGGSTATVGTYVDEVPFGSSGGWQRAIALGLDLLPYDLERIEVLRGPQGTLYGANSMGGLVKYVTRAPNLDAFEARLGTEASSVHGADDLGWSGRASANLPIIDGTLAARVSVFHQDTPGFIDNAALGEEDENGVEQQGGRVSLLWRANDAVSLKVAALVQEIQSDGSTGMSLSATTLQPLYGDMQLYHMLPIGFEQTLQNYAATLVWNLGWAELTSATSYAKTESTEVSDVSEVYGPYFPILTGGAVAAGLAPGLLDLELEKVTQELRLASAAGERFEWMLGLFYTSEDGKNLQVVGAQTAAGASIPGLDPLAVLSVPSNYDEYSAFANATYKFTDAFDLTAGLRWSNSEQDYLNQVTAGVLLPVRTLPGSASEEVVNYALSPRYHLNSDVMLYLRVASGYRPGGPNSVAPQVPTPQYDADSIVSYEAGMKSEFFERRLLLDVAVFQIDWEDLQISLTRGGINYLGNGGKAESRGVEFTSTFSPADGLVLGLNAAYTDAQLTQDVPSLGGLSGDRLPFSPRWNTSLTADYTFALGSQWNMRIGGGYRYVGDRLTSVSSNVRSLRMASYAVVDLNAALVSDRWTVRLYGKNVTDERGYLSMGRVESALGQFIRADASIIQPRTVGLAVDYNF